MNESDEKDGFLKFAENLVEWYPYYLHPQVVITLPTGVETNILDDAYWVSQDDELRNEEKDLTQLWWYYHGWAVSGCDTQETEQTLRLWAEHLADYYGLEEGMREAISYDELSSLIYNALTKAL